MANLTVCCRVNVKLGGVNVVPDAKDVPFLSNATQPVLVLGGKAIHPPPGAEGRPSFSAVVGNVDGNVSKYIATSRVQTSRKEMIEDMCEMTKYILQMYDKFRTNVEKKPGYPKRVVFYRYEIFSFGRYVRHLDYLMLAAVFLKASSIRSSTKRSRRSNVCIYMSLTPWCTDPFL